MSILSILSISALVIAVVMSAYVYIELDRLDQITEAQTLCHTLWIEHWKEFTEWELTQTNISEDRYYQKWKKYALDGLVLDDRCLNNLKDAHEFHTWRWGL